MIISHIRVLGYALRSSVEVAGQVAGQNTIRTLLKNNFPRLPCRQEREQTKIRKRKSVMIDMGYDNVINAS
jgi:hypothetical protein